MSERDFTTIGEIALLVTKGTTPTTAQGGFVSAGIPFVKVESILDNGVIDWKRTACIDASTHLTLKRSALKDGDVLFTIAGSIGRVSKVKNGDTPANTNQAVAIIRPDPSKATTDFIYYALRERSVLARALSRTVQSVQANFSLAEIREIPVPRLSIAAQMEVTDLLSALDDKIDLNRRMNETLEAMAQAIFRDWFVDFGPVRRKLAGENDPIAIMGGLTPEPVRAADLAALFPDALRYDGLPDGWRMTSLGEFADLNPESWSSRAPPLNVQYVDLSNTKWGEIESVAPFSWAEAPSRARRVARRGDTLVGTVRPGNGSYTYVGIDGLTASTGFAQLRPKAAQFADLVYIAATNRENIERLSLLADGGAYPAVNSSVVLDTPLPAMPAELASAFAEFASLIRALIEQRKSENRTLAETRDYLLPRLMSGAVRVKEALEQDAAA